MHKSPLTKKANQSNTTETVKKKLRTLLKLAKVINNN